ncbi:hypothetical protein FRB90_002455 [Tulasnella sp. 427]|nr:hypothetical protein FRB90_002455 [Tulasnella sp. 427]
MFRLLLSAGRSRLSCSSTARYSFQRPQPLAVTASTKRWASSTTLSSSTTDPATTDSLKALEEGTQKLEEGDVEGAKTLYKRSLEIKKTPSALFNYGVTCYHTKDFQAAIESWKESIKLQPDSPDAHTNLASAYLMMPMSRPDLALQHLRTASDLAPEDAEIAFNLAAVLEASGQLEEALEQYKRSKKYGVDKADMHVRNVSAKILGKRLKEAADRENEQKS